MSVAVSRSNKEETKEIKDNREKINHQKKTK